MDLPPGTHIYHSRNVLHRRGSVSASDPFGMHTEENLSDARALMSRLTIVRVPTDDDFTPTSSDSRRSNWSPTLRTSQSGRLSFASSSFAQESISPPVPNSPPSYASRKRRPSTSLYAQRSSLTPEQLCDLALSSIQPRSKADPVEPHSSHHSPLHSPAHSSTTSLSNTAFLPLPDGQFLPFLDRPNEVLEFISTSPTNRLMALLEQAFPAHLRRQRPHLEEAIPSSPSSQTDGSDPQHPVKGSYRHTPPQAWSYEALLEWMSTVPRSEAGDALWVYSIRTCVMARSEQICVTLLAALGVPMEGGADLDVVSLPIGLPDINLALPELSTNFADGPLAQLPTVPEVPINENEDAFQLEILPITFESNDEAIKSDAQRCSRSGSTSSWSPSSRCSSRLSTTMESIGESDGEHDVDTGTDNAPVESEDEHLPGEVTVRAGSPVGMNATETPELKSDHDLLSEVAEQWENDRYTDGDRDRMTWDQVENCYGLSISTCARLAADPSLPSTVPNSAMPHAVASTVRPKQRRNTVQVSHVLSGAPGYEGFTWRPGGPLFPMSFTGSTGSNEGSGPGLGIGGNSDSFMTSNPVLKPRSRSRTKRSSSLGSRAKTHSKLPLTPPNSPVAFIV